MSVKVIIDVVRFSIANENLENFDYNEIYPFLNGADIVIGLADVGWSLFKSNCFTKRIK